MTMWLPATWLTRLARSRVAHWTTAAGKHSRASSDQLRIEPYGSASTMRRSKIISLSVATMTARRCGGKRQRVATTLGLRMRRLATAVPD